jgi:Ankyrin repeats (3 copies)
MMPELGYERIDDYAFRRALEWLDGGDVAALQAHLAAHPDVARRRIAFDPDGYFAHPALLDFVADNPIRRHALPPNALEITRVVIDAGAGQERNVLDSALGLVASGLVARESGLQGALIELLARSGAEPDSAMQAALAHGEFVAAAALVRCGAARSLSWAAATGDLPAVRTLLVDAGRLERHAALALAALHGRTEVVALLLDAGEDPNRYNPPGCHSHATPLHQAAYAGHVEVVRALVERGASLDTRDRHYDGTPREWAEHGGHPEIVRYLADADRK